MEKIKFEKISEFKDIDITMPVRKTAAAAGYDIYAAADIVIEPYIDILYNLTKTANPTDIKSLEDMANITKVSNLRPTLIPTGIKCKMESNQYLELVLRSSCPLKYWLIMGNSVGIIDSDYYNNPDNEGHIYFQVINLSPFPIEIKKGEAIGQGIIKNYLTTDNDNFLDTKRTGGFGSTG